MCALSQTNKATKRAKIKTKRGLVGIGLPNLCPISQKGLLMLALWRNFFVASFRFFFVFPVFRCRSTTKKGRAQRKKSTRSLLKRQSQNKKVVPQPQQTMAVIFKWRVNVQFVAWLTRFFALDESRLGTGKVCTLN